MQKYIHIIFKDIVYHLGRGTKLHSKFSPTWPFSRKLHNKFSGSWPFSRKLHNKFSATWPFSRKLHNKFSATWPFSRKLHNKFSATCLFQESCTINFRLLGLFQVKLFLQPVKLLEISIMIRSWNYLLLTLIIHNVHKKHGGLEINIRNSNLNFDSACVFLRRKPVNVETFETDIFSYSSFEEAFNLNKLVS